MPIRFAALFAARKKPDAVAGQGIDPVIGSLDDMDLLQAEATRLCLLAIVITREPVSSKKKSLADRAK
jgi:hypothetical protein